MEKKQITEKDIEEMATSIYEMARNGIKSDHILKRMLEHTKTNSKQYRKIKKLCDDNIITYNLAYYTIHSYVDPENKDTLYWTIWDELFKLKVDDDLDIEFCNLLRFVTTTYNTNFEYKWFYWHIPKSLRTA